MTGNGHNTTRSQWMIQYVATCPGSLFLAPRLFWLHNDNAGGGVMNVGGRSLAGAITAPDDRTADGKTHAHSPCLSREQGLENATHIRWINSTPGVLDRDMHGATRAAGQHGV